MKPTREEILEKAEELRGRDTSYEIDVLEVTNWAIKETLKDCIELDWPEHAKTASIIYLTSHGTPAGCSAEYKRPQQQPKFKVGDPVFCNNSNSIFKIIDINYSQGSAKLTGIGMIAISTLKPAKLEDIGKEWEAI